MTEPEPAHRWQPRRSRHEHAPPRRSRNGHSPDCPIWHQYDRTNCPCCRAETLGRKDHE